MTPSFPLFARFILTIGLITVLSWLFVNHGLSYRISGYRPCPRTLNKHLVYVLKSRFQHEFGNHATTADLREFALNYTASSLHFTLKSNSLRDADKIIAGRGAHCAMYSVVLSEVYNELAREMHWNPNCRPAIGRVYLYGVNLHQFARSSFFASHDFCVMPDEYGAQAVDALAYDCIGVPSVRLRP